MYHWHKSPFIRLCIPFLIGTAVGKYHFLPDTCQFPALITLALLGVALSFSIKRYIRLIPLFGIWMMSTFLFLGMWNSNRFFSPEVAPLSSRNNPIEFKGEIKELLKSEKYQKVIANVTFVDSSKSQLKALLYLPKDSCIIVEPGQFLYGRGDFQEINQAGNPFAFDYKAYMHNRRIHFQAFIKENEYLLIDPLGFSIDNQLFKFKSQLIARYKRLIPDRNAFDLVTALVLGDQKNMDHQLTDAYRKTGSVHILSVSGLHVAIVCHIILIFSGFFLKRWKSLQAIFAFAALLIYVLLTGAGPAILRSGIMSAILLFAFLAKGKQQLVNGLAAAALLILLWQPGQLWDIGFQLSFLALIGILVFQPLFQNLTANLYWIPKSIDQMITAGFAAQLATFPLVLYYFHQFPWYFWLSGILVVPIAEGLLWVGIGTLLVDFIIPAISFIPGYLLLALAWIQNKIIIWIAELPGAVTEGIWIPDTAVLLLSLGLAWMAHAWLIKSSRQFLYCSTVFSVGFLVIFQHQFQFVHREKWVIYQSRTGIIIDHLLDKQLQTFNASVDSIGIERATMSCRQACQIRSTLNHSIAGNTLLNLQVFQSKMIVLDPQYLTENLYKLDCDYLVLFGKCKVPEDNPNNMQIGKVILCQSVPEYLRIQWQVWLSQNRIPYFDISQSGAFSLTQ
ncbi:MAG: ComEC/Rec2 family competence protein [Saprospiraceae bacterium]